MISELDILSKKSFKVKIKKKTVWVTLYAIGHTFNRHKPMVDQKQFFFINEFFFF